MRCRGKTGRMGGRKDKIPNQQSHLVSHALDSSYYVGLEEKRSVERIRPLRYRYAARFCDDKVLFLSNQRPETS